MLARISQYSAQQLHLETGQSLFIQVKSAALLD
ncbi:MAG: TOBE domain-containing protein [Burkholderiaceae bacterium]